MNIQAILSTEKGRTAQAQAIFAEKAKEEGIKEFTKEECKYLRNWFKTEVINFDAFFATKQGNDALCHGLKNLQKGAQAQKAQDAEGADAGVHIEEGEKGAEHPFEGEGADHLDAKCEGGDAETPDAEGQDAQGAEGADAEGQDAEPTEGTDAEGQDAEGTEGTDAEGQGAEGAEGADAEGQGAEGAEGADAEGQGAEGADAEGQDAEPTEGTDAEGQDAEPTEGTDAEGQDAEGTEGTDAEGQGAEGAEGADAEGQGAEGAEGADAEGQGAEGADAEGQDAEPVEKIDFEDLTEEEKECYSLIQENLIPYLYGPAGTGKTTAAEHIANALGLNFYFTPSVFEKFDLTGFVDGNGNLIDTPFINAFTKGGLFLFDEWDVSDPQAIKFFNMVLSQRMFVIPKYGIVKAHKDFKIMAAGNTKGTGATANYPTALVQDASCRNRFIPIFYGYNEEVESKLACKDAALISFVHDLRDAVKESGLDTVISYRNVINCKTMQGMQYYKGKDALIIKRCFAGDFDADNFDMVSANLTTNNKYTKLFKSLEIEG